MPKLIGILLAAGSSLRFGSNKLLHPLANGQSIAVQACINLQVATDKVIAVVSSDSDKLASQLQAVGADVVICPHAGQGMGASLAFAIQQSLDAHAWLIALGDMPWIAQETIIHVAEALRSGEKIVAPCFNGLRGHPVGFSSDFASALTSLSGDNGAKAIIQAHINLLKVVDTNDSGIIRDIDRLSDLNIL